MKKIQIEKDLTQPPGIHNLPQECVRTSCVKHLIEYPYSHFNPMQSEFIEYLDKDVNVVISSPTGSGKTLPAELAIAMSVFTSNLEKKAIFLAPMRSLTEQKLRDWTDKSHTFSKIKTSVLNGDYSLNKEKAKELESAQIVVATSEMIDSKSRNYANNKWLHNVGVLIVDEVHLIGSEERGPRLETAIMRFMDYSPDTRILLMSATLPNVVDLVEWLKNLSKKETVLVSSDYRPCMLKKHFLEFNDLMLKGKNQYSETEDMRMKVVYDQVMQNPNDQHMVFVGNKQFGRNMTGYLQRHGMSCEFHNADIDKDLKKDFEAKLNSEEIKVLVSTSTLAWGMNLNTRRVILSHTAYGKTEMDIADIDQACGRAGRSGFHTEGDAYILIPASKAYAEMKRILGGYNISSKLKDQKILAFHIVSEIASEKIKSTGDVLEWYKRSLAYSQKHELTEDDCDSLLSRLKSIKMIKKDDKDNWIATQLGQITSIMYQKPFDVYDWYRNFSMLKNIGLPLTNDNKSEAEEVDLQVCWALANIDSFQETSGAYISAAEKNSDMVTSIAKKTGKLTPVTKIAACYWAMLKGEDPDDALRSLFYTIKGDMQRVLFTLQLVHSKYAGFLSNQTDQMIGWKYELKEWDRLFLRLNYGVSRNKVFLVSLPGVGKVNAEKLFKAGIRTKNDFLNKKVAVQEIIGKGRAEKLYNYIATN